MSENISYMLAVVVTLLITVLLCLNFYNMNKNYAQTDNVKSDTKYKDKNTIIKMYYAPWCGVSIAFMPEWEKLVNIVKNKYNNVKTETIDCELNETNTNICKKENITGYPTIKIFDGNNNVKEFSGRRDADEILRFALLN
jgi:thiol-disulfide isomerase/thioredoxin